MKTTRRLSEILGKVLLGVYVANVITLTGPALIISIAGICAVALLWYGLG